MAIQEAEVVREATVVEVVVVEALEDTVAQVALLVITRPHKHAQPVLQDPQAHPDNPDNPEAPVNPEDLVLLAAVVNHAHLPAPARHAQVDRQASPVKMARPDHQEHPEVQEAQEAVPVVEVEVVQLEEEEEDLVLVNTVDVSPPWLALPNNAPSLPRNVFCEAPMEWESEVAEVEAVVVPQDPAHPDHQARLEATETQDPLDHQVLQEPQGLAAVVAEEDTERWLELVSLPDPGSLQDHVLLQQLPPLLVIVIVVADTQSRVKVPPVEVEALFLPVVVEAEVIAVPLVSVVVVAVVLALEDQVLRDRPDLQAPQETLDSPDHSQLQDPQAHQVPPDPQDNQVNLEAQASLDNPDQPAHLPRMADTVHAQLALALLQPVEAEVIALPQLQLLPLLLSPLLQVLHQVVTAARDEERRCK